MKHFIGALFLAVAGLIGMHMMSINASSSIHQAYQGILLIACICSAGFGCLIMKGK